MNVRRVSEAKSISKRLFSICSVIATFAPFRVIPAVLASSDVIPRGVAGPPPGGLLVLPPPPVGDFRHVVAVLADVLFVFDKLLAECLLEVRCPAPNCGSRSITSMTRWQRSKSFRTTMSNGVVVVPSSL